MRPVDLSRLLAAAMCFTVALNMPAQEVEADLENEVVRHFLRDFVYERDSTSRVAAYYSPAPPRLDIPAPVTLRLPETSADTLFIVLTERSNADLQDTIRVASDTLVSIYNLVPQSIYLYTVMADSATIASGKIRTRGQVRMIYGESLHNVRDIGGWPTADGRQVKYRKIYRGAELNGQYVATEEDIDMLRRLGIGAEIDMRRYKENDGAGKSAFGFYNQSRAPAGDVATYLYTNNSGMILDNMTVNAWLSRWRQEFNFVVNNLRRGRPIYIHCVSGADRTGLLVLLLEGLLGVPYDGLIKDYELTTFFPGKLREKEKMDPIIDFIETLDGETLQQKFVTYFKTYIGVNALDIEFFINEMLGKKTTFDAIEDATTRPSRRVTGIYDLHGRRSAHVFKGIRIEMMSDGRVRKVAH